MGEPTPAHTGSVAERVIKRMGDEESLSAQSLPRLADLAGRFFSYLGADGAAVDLGLVGEDLVAEFLRAPTVDGAPSVATMHLRRSAVRLVFRTARPLGLADGDPSLDLVLPPRSSLRTRPLADDEAALCRSASLHTLEETRLPAGWALAACGVRSSELGHVRVADLDLGKGRVWIAGTSRTEPRWIEPADWGLLQLQRRVRSIGGDADRPLLYSGRSGSDYHRQAASCVAISTVLRLAGLSDEPDVHPLSVTGWAGRQVLVDTGRIEVVARRLGVRSLDRAARLIAWDWTEPPGDSE